MTRIYITAMILALGPCLPAVAARSVQTGQLLAAGPAWAVDVARVTGHSFAGDSADVAARGQGNVSEAVYVPANAHWFTYVIRSGDTTYICREKNAQLRDGDAVGEAVQFDVHGAHLTWKGAAGHKHTAFLVMR